MKAIRVSIQSIGGHKCVVIPKVALVRAGLDTATRVELTIKCGVIRLRKPSRPPRAGWSLAAEKLEIGGGDTMVMGEFNSDADSELTW